MDRLPLWAAMMVVLAGFGLALGFFAEHFGVLWHFTGL